MIYKTVNLPALTPSVGDVWLCPHNSFKRVYSRGGAWENVNLGSKHPDEADHEQSEQPKAQLGHDGAEVSSGADPAASGNGDDGKVPDAADGVIGAQDSGLTGGHTDDGRNPHYEGEGVDGNGSPVV